MDAQVVGRDERLAQLDRFVRGLAGGPETLVVEGEAGIGKTTLWKVAVDAAVERGYSVLGSRPSESEAGLAYSGLADLLEHADRSSVVSLPEPQRSALEVALLVSEPVGGAPEPRAIYAAFGGVLRSLSRETPVLVAVDDLQWLDRSSLRALEYVSRRIGDERVGIIATVRLDAHVATPARAGLADAVVVELGPLSPAALYQLIKVQLDARLPRSTVLRIHRETGGNPFFALELARVLVVAGLPGAGEPWPVTDDLRAMVGARVARLPKSVRSALLLAAASSRPTVAGLGVSAVRAAERAGIVTVGEHGQVRFAHPLFAAAVYGNAAVEERRCAHASLADAETDVEARARHRALACADVDEEVAELLVEAATRADHRGAPDIAAELQERAFMLTPPDRRDDLWERRVKEAEYHLRTGDLERARTLLIELADEPRESLAQSRVFRLLGETCYRMRFLDEAIRCLREAITAADGDPAAVARAELDLTYILLYSFASFAEADAAAGHALANAALVGNDALLASALAASAVTGLVLGAGLDEEKLAHALSLEDRDHRGPIERQPSFVAGWALLQTDQLDHAKSVLEPLRDRLIARGEESDLPDVLALLARTECLAGNLAEAEQLADDGYDLAMQEGSDSLAASTRAVRALVAAHAGRVEETRAAAADAIELARRSGWQIAAFYAATALGHLELVLGNDAAVVATLASSIALVEEQGVGEPSRRPFLPDAIEALVHLDELDRADRLTQMLEQSGRELQRPWAIVSGARCRALVLAARGEAAAALDGLERTLAEHPMLPMPLEQARTLIVKGQLERRRKQKRLARESLERALGLCEAIGATLWAERAHAELARIRGVPEPNELSPTEARVAALAASGLTNREIAASAFMSQKTVESNLSHVYRKLGIRSRAELGVKLATVHAPQSSRQPGSR